MLGGFGVKKGIAILLALGIIFSMFGCQAVPSAGTTQPTQATTITPTTTPSATEPLQTKPTETQPVATVPETIPHTSASITP